MKTYFAVIFLCFAASAAAWADQPNVVLIVCDDLNDYITGIPGEAGHPQARTPNVEKLAESGVAFRRAYSNSPVCAPSRASFLNGIYPHTSRLFGFWPKWFEKPVLKNSKTMMEHFKDNGYRVVGSGKLMHNFKNGIWHEFPHRADYGPFVNNGTENIAHPSVPEPFSSIGAVDGSFAPLSDVPFAEDDNPMSGWVYNENWQPKPMRYVSEEDRDPTPDERNAQWAADRIKRFAEEDQGQPFFLGVGFIRPHTPLHVPKKYFDMFPQKGLQLPVIKENDAEDCYYAEVYNDDVKGLKYFRLLKASYPELEDGIRAFTQAYLASVAAVDECIGQVVEAVDNSPFKDNTIIVLVSDHGWNMGEKDFLFKNSLWEESTRIPFVVRAPGVTKAGRVAGHPVSLIDLYPTLVDLCGLQGDTRKNDEGASLDGHSVRPFLEDPENGIWDGPDAALSTIINSHNVSRGVTDKTAFMDPARQNWSVRTKRWRYIRYHNGMEELYDHDNDPNEWTNLAGKSALEGIKQDLYGQILKQTRLKEL